MLVSGKKEYNCMSIVCNKIPISYSFFIDIVLLLWIIKYSYGFLQLSELEQRVIEAETRAEDAEDKVRII